MALRNNTSLNRGLLKWHLTDNHVPPVPLDWLPICEEILSEFPDTAEEAEEYLSSEIDSPMWCSNAAMSVRDVVNGLHLWEFLQTSNTGEQDESEDSS